MQVSISNFRQMALELQVLRTAKAALDEGLLENADYERVKSAFMQALAIKGGVDSGFLGDSDMQEARAQFFQAAGMSGFTRGSLGTQQLSGVPQQQQQHSTPSRGQEASRSNGRGAPSASPAAAAQEGSRATPRQLSIPDKGTSPGGSTGGPTPKSNIGTPAAVSSRGGGAAAVADKVHAHLRAWLPLRLTPSSAASYCLCNLMLGQ